MNLQIPIVCVITRVRGLAESSERTRLLERLAAAADAGAAMIQVRERLFNDRDLTAFIRDLVRRVDGSGVCVLVNDRVDIALAAGAGGVHLKSDGPAASEVRAMVPAGFVIGRSIHSAQAARVASGEGGYDYLLFGTVFRSDSKPEGHSPAGLAALADACAAAGDVPVVAIGGIDVARARHVRGTGAAGVAAISLFANAPDIAEVVRETRAALTLPEGTV